MSFIIENDDRMSCGKLIIKQGHPDAETTLNVELPMAGHETHMLMMISNNYNKNSDLIYLQKNEAKALVDYINNYFKL